MFGSMIMLSVLGVFSGNRNFHFVPDQSNEELFFITVVIVIHTTKRYRNHGQCSACYNIKQMKTVNKINNNKKI